jgi:hypothetical protein
MFSSWAPIGSQAVSGLVMAMPMTSIISRSAGGRRAARLEEFRISRSIVETDKSLPDDDQGALLDGATV